MPLSPRETVAGHILVYTSEILNDAYRSSSLFEDLGLDNETTTFLHAVPSVTVAATGVLTKQIYDMAHRSESPLTKSREEAARLGGLTLILSDVLDDEVDKSSLPLEDKKKYLDAIASHLHTGTPSFDLSGRSVEMHTAHSLADYLHRDYKNRGGLPRIAQVMDPLVAAVKTQFESTDIEEQLQLTNSIGALCGEISVAAVAVVDGKERPELVIASHGLGAYGLLLDNAMELRDDLVEGSLAYGPLYLQKNGNTPDNHASVKRTLIDQAKLAYRNGGRSLTPRQRTIYGASRRLLELKYRVYGPTRSIKRRYLQRNQGVEV